MADCWDNIEGGFNAADETINFGTRNVAGLDNLYETSTLASIKCTKECSHKRPNINAAIRNGSIFFSIDNTFKVFNDLLCTDLSFNASFDDVIDAFCVTSKGEYLFLCLRSGIIHCIEMENGAIIYTECIVENDNTNEPVFVNAFVENESVSPSFLLILSNGKVYRITTTDASPVSDKSPSEKFNFMHDLLTDVNGGIQTAAFLNPLLLMAAGEAHICNVQTKKTDCNYICELKRLISHNRMFLGLDSNGRLINICTKTLLTYSVVTDVKFDDILLIHDTANSHILGVTKVNELGVSYLQLLTYPEYSNVFALKMSGKIHLITPEHAHDEIIYISEIMDGNNVSELRFQVVSETAPENRFKRLLQKQKFDEAEHFAQLFELDLEEIQKAKAQVIVDKSICCESDIDSLLNILNTVEDDAFKIQSCLDTHGTCNSLKDVERILNYGYSLLFKSNEILCKESQDLILELMFRFKTLMTLVRCGGKKHSVQEWIDFSKCDLIKELCTTLAHNHIEESIIIYSRLDTTTISNLKENHIQDVLDTLNNLSMEEQLPFLITFLPLTLSYLPLTLDLFIKWIIQMVFQTETRHPKKFPENAMKFMKKMVHFLKIESSVGINFQQQYTPDQRSLQQLSDLLEALVQLQTLKNNYRIVVPLQQFLQPKEELIETLLLNQGIDFADNFLEEFIPKFMRNYQLEPDLIFTNVVKDMTKYAEEFWIKVVPAILNSISSINLKLEATLIILKAACLPWSATIHEIASKAIQYSHPLVKEIMQEIEYEPKCVILNKNPYQLKKRYINSMEELKHAVNRIIYCNQPSMIEDIYQICKDSKENHEANVLLIIHFIKIGAFTKALQVLNDNSQEEVIKCCKHFEVFLTIAIDNKYKMNPLQENCFQILGSIFQKLQDNAEEYEKDYFQERLETLRGVYKIRQHFNLFVVSEDLEDRRKKSNILDNLMRCTINDFQEKNDLLGWTQNCEKISTYLGIDKNIILLKLCQRVGDFNVILRAAENLYLSDADAGSLCHIVALILKSLGSANIPFENYSQKCTEESFLQNLGNTDINLFIDGLKLAGKMVVRAMLKSNKDEIGNCVELANWVQITYYMTQDNIKHSPIFSKDAYRGDLILPSIPSLNAIRDFFVSYKKIIGPVPQPHRNAQYLMYFDSNVPKLKQAQLTTEIESLQPIVTCLCTEGRALVAYKLLATVQKGLVFNSCTDPDINIYLNSILNWCTKQLLQNVFAARQIDTDLAYSLLLSCDLKYSHNFLYENLAVYKRDAPKFKTIAQIFLRYLQYHKIQDHQHMCINIIYLFKWWNRIKNCQIPYDRFFRKSPADVLKNLIKLNQMDIDCIKEFCLDFKLDENIYYEFYLQNLLLSWKADYVFQTNTHGTKLLIVKNDENQLIQDSMEVINVIKSKDSVCDMLNHTLGNINFYHYEVFTCVLNILSVLKPNTDNHQKNLMLSFLKNYNRVSKPGKTEEEEWFTLYPDTQCIGLLSEWRLPFTSTLFTNKIWSIIRPEINLKTYTKWFEAIPILEKKLRKDDICSYVIKGIVSSGVFHRKSSSDWVLHEKHNDLLMEVEACIKNMSNLEQATSAVYYLTTNIPGGADQVTAITLCYKYAKEYQNLSLHTEEVQKAFIKVEKKYFSFSATHILHTNNLANKQYLKMVSGPVDELIEALYMDDRIIKKAAFVISYCPDVNNTVNELAALYSIDVQKERKLLLDKWLSNTAFSVNTINMVMVPNIKYQNQCDDLIRASYMCKNDDVSVWRTRLLQLGHVNATESVNLNFKANALKCFCSISDIETIERLTGATYNEFRNFVNKLMLISCLECFGFSLNIESLDEYNKKDLLRRLASNMTNPVCVKAMALVCTAYTIYDAKYWLAIMNAMLELKMVQELKECVTFLKKSTIFHNKKFYIDAWQTVINSSFDLTLNLSEEELNCLYIENFHGIQSCPVLSALDLEYVIKKCLQIKKYDFAALAIQYVTKEKQTVYLKEILDVDQDIYKKIDELAQEGFWGVTFIKHLLKQLQQKEVPSTE